MTTTAPSRGTVLDLRRVAVARRPARRPGRRVHGRTARAQVAAAEARRSRTSCSSTTRSPRPRCAAGTRAWVSSWPPARSRTRTGAGTATDPDGVVALDVDAYLAERGDVAAIHRAACSARRLAARVHRLLRPARVGDGLPRDRRAPAPAPAAARLGRHRRRRRVAPASAARTSTPTGSSLPRRSTATRCARRAPPGGHGAARLPARRDGRLQVGHQARPRRAGRPAAGLLRARAGHPRRSTCRRRRTT